MSTKQLEYPRARVEPSIIRHSRGDDVIWRIGLVAKPGDFYRVHPVYHLEMGVAMTVAANIVRTERAKLASVPPASAVSVPPAPAQVLKDMEEERRQERRARLPRPVPTRCPGCMRRVRKASQKVSEWPGTVAMTDREGHCAACKKRRQAEVIAAAEPQGPRQDLVDAVTPPPAPKVVLAEPADGPANEDEEPVRGPAKRKRSAPAKPRRTRAAATPATPPTICAQDDCETPVTRYKASGLCNVHRDEQKLAEPLSPQELQAKQSADAYAAARRRRGVPPEGLRSA